MAKLLFPDLIPELQTRNCPLGVSDVTKTNLVTHRHPYDPSEKQLCSTCCHCRKHTPSFRWFGPALVTARIPNLHQRFWTYPQNTSGNSDLRRVLPRSLHWYLTCPPASVLGLLEGGSHWNVR